MFLLSFYEEIINEKSKLTASSESLEDSHSSDHDFYRMLDSPTDPPFCLV